MFFLTIAVVLLVSSVVFPPFLLIAAPMVIHMTVKAMRLKQAHRAYQDDQAIMALGKFFGGSR